MHGDGNGTEYTNNDGAMLYGANNTPILQVRHAKEACGTTPFGRRVENSSTLEVGGSVRHSRRRPVIEYNHPNDPHDRSVKIGYPYLESLSDGL